jgi:Tfp pilus assembly major pilin PilA
MEAIQTIASEVLVNVALGVIALLGAYAMYYINVGVGMAKAKTAQIKDEASRKLLEDALDDVENLAVKSVGAMEQTTAKALRDAVKVGNGDREKLLALGRQVFDEVKAAITPEAQAVITRNLGSFDAYLTKCIEDAVRRVKQEDPYITLEGELLSADGQ